MSGESVRQRAREQFKGIDFFNPSLDEIVAFAESESSLARKQALREAAQKICSCCQIDGDPTDMIGHSTATPAGDDGGPRFVHFYDDGSRIECGAEEIWPLLHERGREAGE